MGLLTWAKHKFEENWPISFFEVITKVEGFSDVGWGEKFELKKKKKILHKKAHYEGEWNRRQDVSKGEKPKQFQSLILKPKVSFVNKGPPLKGNQPKGDASGKLKGTCFNRNEMGYYSKNCSKPKLGNGNYKVICPYH